MNRANTLPTDIALPFINRTGRFQPYTHVRPTTIEWFGDIPFSWTIAPIKHITSTRVTDGPHETPEFLESGVSFISADSIKDNKIDFTRKRGFISHADHHRFSKKYVPRRGDIYLIKSGATTGNVAIVETDEVFNIWSPLAAIRPDANKMSSRFLFFFLRSAEFRQSIELGWSFGTQQNIGMNVIENLPVAIPPLPEQRTIAAFLDRETQKIDALIAKKERLIELLQEKRTAMISQAVTKGLDPHAEMKDSGIEWLGKVPAHWPACKMGYIAAMQGGSTPNKDTPNYWNGTIPWVSPKDMKRRDIADSLDHVTPFALEQTNLKLILPPVVLIVVRGMILAHTFPIGVTSVPVTVNQDMKALSVREGVCHHNFLAYLLDGIGSVILALLVEESGHGTKVLRTDLWKRIAIYLPLLEEQQLICNEVEIRTSRILTLLKRVSEAIHRLREYRTALISAAVTGKIDVRKEVPADDD